MQRTLFNVTTHRSVQQPVHPVVKVGILLTWENNFIPA
jgi:hypothetical protein